MIDNLKRWRNTLSQWHGETWIALLAAMFALGSLVVTCKQTAIMKAQFEDSTQIKLAHAQMEAMKKQFELENTPFLSLRPPNFSVMNGELYITTIVVNHGQFPVKVTRFKQAFSWDKDKMLEYLRAQEWSEPTGDYVSKEIPFVMVNPTQWKAEPKKGKHFWVLGSIEYENPVTENGKRIFEFITRMSWGENDRHHPIWMENYDVGHQPTTRLYAAD